MNSTTVNCHVAATKDMELKLSITDMHHVVWCECVVLLEKHLSGVYLSPALLLACLVLVL